MGVFFCISLIKHKMKVTLFFVLIAAIAVLGQGDFDLVERIVLDDFTNGANTHGISVTLSADIGVNDPDRTETEMFDAGSGCTGLLGCERDMSLTIFIGLQGRTFSSDIFTTPATYYFDGEWAVSNPKNSESEFILQYDGRDNTFSLDTNGLGNVDLTDNGLVTRIRLSAVTDLDTAYNIIAYSPNGQSCTASIDVLTAGNAYDYDYNDSFVFFNFDNLAGGCDKTNIGAVEVELFSNDALDAILRQIAFVGNPDPSNSQTPTPSRTRSPAPTGTGTGTPTPTRTPTRTPSPSGPCVIVCDCPSFTCQIAYDRDDDQNTISYSVSRFVFDDDDSVTYVYVDDDANPDDDGIVYVYVDDDDGISTGFTTLFSTGFTTLFSTGFSSFTSLFSTGFTSAFSSFTSFTSFDGRSFSFGSSSSDASTVAASFVMMAVLAVLA